MDYDAINEAAKEIAISLYHGIAQYPCDEIASHADNLVPIYNGDIREQFRALEDTDAFYDAFDAAKECGCFDDCEDMNTLYMRMLYFAYEQAIGEVLHDGEQMASIIREQADEHRKQLLGDYMPALENMRNAGTMPDELSDLLESLDSVVEDAENTDAEDYNLVYDEVESHCGDIVDFLVSYDSECQ